MGEKNTWGKWIISTILVFGSFFTVSTVNIKLWQVSENGFAETIWQNARPVLPQNSPTGVEASYDGSAVEIQSKQGIWSSPLEWQVRQAVWSDLNHDSNPELTLLVRRPFKPWPIDRLLPNGGRINAHQDTQGMSSHIIMIGWKKDHWGEVWAGSALARPVTQLVIADIDNDGQDELVTAESMYANFDISGNSSLAVWDWDGFGFELDSRIERSFDQFSVLTSGNDRIIILTD
jgi:hypothetical protein